MTNLTEQFKKGELPDDEYYCRTTHYSSVRKHYLSDIDNENMIEVLAPVPSYEDWMEKTKSLKVLAEAYCKEKQQNDKLKELLKECEHMIIAYSINNNTFTKEEIKNIISKIDQVLGEE